MFASGIRQLCLEVLDTFPGVHDIGKDGNRERDI